MPFVVGFDAATAVPRQRHPPAAVARLTRQVPPSVWLVAALFLALEAAVSGRYGFHRDELYFVVAGRHPALGYVDQPPLAPLLTRVATALFGVSPTAVRIFPALAGAGVVVTTALTARLLGAGRRAQLLAATAMACAPVTLAAAHLANTTVYDLLAWSGTIACVLAAVLGGRTRAWLGAGLCVGLGLENKDLLLLLAAAVVIGLIATDRRRVLANRWLWLGAGIAIVLWMPNLIWQATHGWPERVMSQSLHAEHSAGGDYATVLPAQLVYLGIASVPLAAAGLRQLLRVRTWRFLAIAVGVVLLFVITYIPGRPYYTGGLLPLVFAAGALTVERRAGPGSLRRWLIAPVAGLLATVVLVLPILPERAIAHMPFLHKLNYDLGETIGWPQLTHTIATVYDRLPPAQRSHAAIFAANYGEASALLVYGHRLPPVLSGHNSFSEWGPGHAPDTTVIAVGTAGDLRAHFRSCTPALTFRSPRNVNNDENGTAIDVCTGPRASWSQIWNSLRHFD